MKASNIPTGWSTDTNREYLKSLLEHNVMRIVFLKRDGTERTLICTRKTDLIPEANRPKKKRETPNSLPVWSMEDEGWRSFRYERLRHVETIPVQLVEDNNPEDCNGEEQNDQS